MKKRIFLIPPIVLQAVIYIFSYCLFRLFGKFKIEGFDNVKHLKSGIIFAANHSSEWDGILLRVALPFWSLTFSPMYYVAMGKSEYRDSGWRNYIYGGFFFKLLGAYPRYKGKQDYAYSLQNHIRILELGRNVCIFPEGRRNRDGEVKEAHGGVAFLASSTGKPLVPVSISGLVNFSLTDLLLRRRSVTITFGHAIEADRLKADGDNYKKVATYIMNQIRGLTLK